MRYRRAPPTNAVDAGFIFLNLSLVFAVLSRFLRMKTEGFEIRGNVNGSVGFDLFLEGGKVG